MVIQFLFEFSSNSDLAGLTHLDWPSFGMRAESFLSQAGTQQPLAAYVQPHLNFTLALHRTITTPFLIATLVPDYTRPDLLLISPLHRECELAAIL